MSKKKIIIITIILVILIVVGLWIGGIIPEFIAKIVATNYLKNNFPKKQYEFVSIEWNSYLDGYSIKFKDEKGKEVGFVMNNKYLPIDVGQGIFAIEEEYRKEFEGEKQSSSADTEYSFFAKVIESDTTHLIVEPREDEKERKSADKISIGLEKNNDVVYMVGTTVKITYDGTIMSTYPLQIHATKIELKSAENFEILFKERQPIDSYNKVYAILDKSETEKYNYTIYAYDGSVNIKIDGKEYSLKEALLENRITMEEIIKKANEDFPNAVSYDDGGSMEYHYENYTIIKCHTLNGNRDVYIGTKSMTLNDVL